MDEKIFEPIITFDVLSNLNPGDTVVVRFDKNMPKDLIQFSYDKIAKYFKCRDIETIGVLDGIEIKKD